MLGLCWSQDVGHKSTKMVLVFRANMSSNPCESLHDMICSRLVFVTPLCTGNCGNGVESTWNPMTVVRTSWCLLGILQVIQVLIDNGAMRENQHFVDAQGQTPLHIAVAASQIQAVETLVSKCPAWISAKDLPPHSTICFSSFCS